MSNLPLPEDLKVFIAVARTASFVTAAEALGLSATTVSKRIRILEATLGTKLLHRTTRRVTVTQEGERTYALAERILGDMDLLLDELSVARRAPRGLLRVCSSFGFGRNYVAGPLGEMITKYPALNIRLEVFDRLVDLGAEGFDLDVRVGNEIAPRHIATHLASNHRILCAAPSYIARRGLPKNAGDLASHDCLVIKERDHPFGTWSFKEGDKERMVKVTGPLASNNGEIVRRWAIEGRGIILRSVWDLAPHLHTGELVHILPAIRQEANIWAVHPQRLSTSVKIRVCVEFLQQHFAATEKKVLAGLT